MGAGATLSSQTIAGTVHLHQCQTHFDESCSLKERVAVAGHTEHDLPNGRAMNGVMLNGAPQSESDPDSDSDEFGREPVPPHPSSIQASTATIEHSRKQPSGQRRSV